MKRFVLFVALSAMSIASVQAAFAQTFSMKGVLRDPLGRTVDDGQYQLTFKLYDAATGGNELWSETLGSVPVQHGVFSVELGTQTSMSGLSFGSGYYLGIVVADGPELEPRIKLTPIPYSLSVVGAENRFPSKGKVGIGIVNPEAKLQVVGDGTKAATFTGGSVGIGTTAPTNKLTVTGDADVTGNLGVGTATPTNKLSVSGDADITGNVGIGVAAPAHKLDVDGNIDYTQLTHLDMVENGAAILRAADLMLGHSTKRGSPGRGLVDLGTGLQVNFGGDWANTILGGNVGIGTASPTSKLGVVDGVTTLGFQDNTHALVVGRAGEGPGLELRSSTGGGPFIDFANDATTDHHARLRLHTSDLILENANLGIGTTVPTAKLDVNGNIKLSSGALIFADGSSLATATLSGSAGSVSNPSDALISSTGGTVQLQTGGGTRMVVTNGGDVGIGTTSPGAKLEIKSDASASRHLRLRHPHANHYYWDIYRSQTNGGLVFRDHSDGTEADRLTINPTGEVGIGTTSPVGMLQVLGKGVFGANAGISLDDNATQGIIHINDNKDLTFWDSAAHYSRFFITSGGNIGIGTDSPGAKLEVADGASDPIKYGSLQITRSPTNNGDNKLYLSMVRQGNSAAGLGFVPNTNVWGLFNNDTDAPALVVNNDNMRVGIGTTSPVGMLQVMGRSIFGANAGIALDDNASQAIIHINGNKDLTFWDSAAGYSRFFINSGGDVGMGTTTPGAALHVHRGETGVSSIYASGTGQGAGMLYVGQSAAWGGGLSYDGGSASPDIIGEEDHVTFFRRSNSVDIEVFSCHVNSNDVTFSGSVTATAHLNSSDRRFKKGISSIENSLAKVLALRGVSFQWRRDEFPGREFGEEDQLGFIAQELKEVLPEAVRQGEDGYYSVFSPAVVAVMVEGMKEQQEQIEALREENAGLKAQVLPLETTVRQVRELERQNASLQSEVKRLRKLEAKMVRMEDFLKRLERMMADGERVDEVDVASGEEE